ncbi:MAG TPA: VWA domain-containing protein [Chthoniobacterales bacterium]
MTAGAGRVTPSDNAVADAAEGVMPAGISVDVAADGTGLGSAMWIGAQDSTSDNSVIRKVVEMVQLNVAVTDRKGNYVTGLQPSDFVVAEDRINQKIATFEEGSGGTRAVAAAAPANADPPGASGNPVATSSTPSVYILFDTSNYMYRGRGFVFAQDAIAQFVRSIDGPDRIAFYSYSRDLSRQTSLTADRSQVLHGVRATVNGDDSALYNALLLTLKDAGQQTGRKAVVVFSNGPDNSSMVPPEDVGELAQSEGIPIYMVSTHDAKLDAVTAAVFARISANTGGEAYFAKNWKDQEQAFTSIRDDLAHLYLISYYPQPNPNRGWRAITVKLAGEKARQYHIRTRDGYRPLPEHLSIGSANAAGGQ